MEHRGDDKKTVIELKKSGELYMEHHDDGKTMVIELKKDADTQNKEDDITLTHSSLFPVKPKKASFFRNPTFLAAVLLLLLVVAVFLLVSSIGAGHDPAETTTGDTTENTDPPTVPAGAFYVTGLSEAARITNDITSNYALLAEADSLKAIATKNGNDRMYPASLTKIMTFLVAYDCLSEDLDKQLPMTQEIHNQYPDASRIGLVEDIGDLVTVEQCMYAMLLGSDTDAVLMLVQEAAGDETAFVELMNQKAQELELTSTHFTNANGLHHDKHVSTPAEMAVIFAKALQNELFHKIITTYKHETYLGYYKDDGLYATYRMTYFNSTLRNRFQAYNISTELSNGITIIGGKTGYTPEAGCCQAALAVDENGKEYIAILGHAPSAKVSASDTAYLYRNYLK